MSKEPKDPTKLFNLIWMIGAIIFCCIAYAAGKFGYLPLLIAVIVATFGAAMWAINKNKK